MAVPMPPPSDAAAPSGSLEPDKGDEVGVGRTRYGSGAEVASAACDAVSLTHAPGFWERRLFFSFLFFSYAWCSSSRQAAVLQRLTEL